jgi:hypothetical protein
MNNFNIDDMCDTESTISTDSYNSCNSYNSVVLEDYDEKINNIKYINIDDEYIDTPNGIITPLFPYQKRALKKMIDIESTGIINNVFYGEERNHIRFLNYSSSPSIIKTSIGIYADELKNNIFIKKNNKGVDIEDEVDIKVGKTLTMIALIKENKNIKNNNIIKKTINGIKLSIIDNRKKLLTQTLVIVEHSECDDILIQFQTHCPELKIYQISTQKHNDNIVIGSWYNDNEWSEQRTKIINRERIIEEDIINYDVILCSNVLYPRFYQSVSEYKWNRIIIFNVEKYFLPYKLEVYFNFLWFVTSNPYELYDKEKPFTGKIFGNESDDKKGLMDYLIVKNRMEDIRNEIKI